MKKRLIESRSYYRTPAHPAGAGDSVVVTLECGHKNHYKGSAEPRKFAFCKECDEREPRPPAEQIEELRADIETLTGYAAETRLLWDRNHDMKVGKRLLAMAGDLPGYNADIDEIHQRRIQQ